MLTPFDGAKRYPQPQLYDAYTPVSVTTGELCWPDSTGDFHRTVAVLVLTAYIQPLPPRYRVPARTVGGESYPPPPGRCRPQTCVPVPWSKARRYPSSVTA